MENINMNEILCRQEAKKTLQAYVETFYNKSLNNKTQKRGLYLFGKSGIGKTFFVKRTLEELNYDVILYDAGESRNKSIIESISNTNLSSVNIMSMLEKKNKKIVLVMDEIDGMNNGDRGGISSLIKLIRPKKTKKQSVEMSCNIPVICISNCHLDKKINELKKVCESIELKPPTLKQMQVLFSTLMPFVSNSYLDYVECDLRKLNVIYQIYCKETCKGITTSILNSTYLPLFCGKLKCDTDIKTNVANILNHKNTFHEHDTMIGDNDRTIIGLLYHENVVDVFEKLKTNENVLPAHHLKIFIQVLENFCFSDYIDRIIFQKQIWQLNELSSLIKTSFNSFIIHDMLVNKSVKFNTIRFTKVLTKYSTEYNNLIFLNDVTQTLLLDKKDIIPFFLYIKQKLENNQNSILQYLSTLNITNLDALRMYRYIEKYTSSIYEETSEDLASNEED
jgi:SpoVK/Ycf46/Vps4 family AAA+-type ATPase